MACVTCGLVRTDPLPTAEELQKFYELEYRQSYKGVRRPKLKHVYRAGLLAVGRYRRVAGYLEADAGVLDVGCASGEWLCALKIAGHKAVGIEADPAYGEFGRQEYGVEIVTGSITKQPPAGEKYGCVTLFHVLEHLSDPVGELRRIQEWAKADGLLVIEVPNILSAHQNPVKRFHYAHVVGFTRQSLAYAVWKAGWEVIEQTTDAYERNLFVLARRRTGEAPGDGSTGPVELSGAPEMAAVSSRVNHVRYYLRPATYGRWAGRMWQYGREFLAVRDGGSARAILESAFRAAGHAGTERTSSGGGTDSRSVPGPS
jgi:SAM-dependent methyltransferase